MPGMLKHTLILPDGDSKLAGKLLAEAIDDLDVVLMLVFGTDGDQEKIVGWADTLAGHSKITDEVFLRHVVWVRKPTVAPVKKVLDRVLASGDLPQVAVLGFHDQEKDRIPAGEEITSLRLLNAFGRGHQA